MVDLIEVEDDESKSWKKKEPGPLKDIDDAGGKEAGGIQSEGKPASLEDVIPYNGEPASLEDEMILLWPTGDDWRAAAELADKLNSQLGVAIDIVLLAGWVAVARLATESSQCMDATSCIGNRIHYIVSTLNSVWAGKITGIFLENDIQDLQEMLCVSDNSKAAALFVERVWQALGVLAQASSLASPCYQDDETPASAKTFPEETASAVSALQPPAASPAPLHAHSRLMLQRSVSTPTPPPPSTRFAFALSTEHVHTWVLLLRGHGSPTRGTHIDPVTSRTRAGHRRVDDPRRGVRGWRRLTESHVVGRRARDKLARVPVPVPVPVPDPPTDGPQQRRRQKRPGSHAGGRGEARHGADRLVRCGARAEPQLLTHPALARA